MTSDELKQWLEKFDWHPIRAAQILRVNDRTVRRWIYKERAIPEWVGLFLEYAWSTRDSAAFRKLVK